MCVSSTPQAWNQYLSHTQLVQVVCKASGSDVIFCERHGFEDR